MIWNIKASRRVFRVFATVLMTLSALVVSAQTGIDTGTPLGSNPDSTWCRNSITLYKSIYQDKDLTRALDPWRQVLAGCPAYSEDIYTDGESMYKSFTAIRVIWHTSIRY
ncbi:MAG: hypothetical protein U5L72_05055 [Bacteroidales bacterium]|nr:hypothetical protein [Bacteroidales bacterium]